MNIIYLSVVLYFYLRSVAMMNRHLLIGIIVTYLAVVLYQAILGLMQVYGIYSSNHHAFKITGSFHNPGPLAGFLVSGIALSLGLYLLSKTNQNKINGNVCKVDEKLESVKDNNSHFCNERTLYMLNKYSQFVLMTLAIALVATQSRAAWLGAIVGSLYVISFFNVGIEKAIRRYFSVLKSSSIKYYNTLRKLDQELN